MLGHATYITFELAWAIPVLAVQWAAGWSLLWIRRRILLIAITLPTIYLSFADGIAIGHGIWALHSNRILGIRFGDVPLEEVVFFLVTNAMVVQSIILLLNWKRRSEQSQSVSG